MPELDYEELTESTCFNKLKLLKNESELHSANESRSELLVAAYVFQRFSVWLQTGLALEILDRPKIEACSQTIHRR